MKKMIWLWPNKLYVDEEVLNLIINSNIKEVLLAGFSQPLNPKRAVQITLEQRRTLKGTEILPICLQVVGTVDEVKYPYHCFPENIDEIIPRHVDSLTLSLEYGKNNSACGSIPPHFVLAIC